MTKLVPGFKLLDPIKVDIGDWLKVFRCAVNAKIIYEVAEVTRLLSDGYVEVSAHGVKRRQFVGSGVFKITHDEAMMFMLENE
jgi:hypothetical protein